MSDRTVSPIRAQIGLDLLIYRRSMIQTLIIGMAFPLLLAVTTRELAVAMPMVLGVGSVFTATAFAQDETAKLDRLYGSLPITRHQFVTARYALLSSWLVGATIVLLVLTAATRPTSIHAWATPLFGADIIILMNAALVPIIVRFGARRSIWILFGLAGLAGAVSMVVGKLIVDRGLLTHLFISPQQLIWALAVGVLTVAVIALGGSWMISQRLYAAKDF